MARSYFMAAFAAALLGSSAAYAADLGVAPAIDIVEEDEGPSFALSGTVGVIAINLPVATGVFTSGADSFQFEGSDWAVGGLVGGSASVTTGSFNDWDVSVGLTGFGAFAHGNSFASEIFSGQGTVVISGLSTPSNSSINLATTRGGGTGSAQSVVVNNNPQGGGSFVNAAQAGAGVSDAGQVSPAIVGNSFVVGAQTVDGPNNRAAAYGAAADTSGGIFIGVGDLDGLTVNQSVSQDIFYGGADLTLALSGSLSENAVLQLYAGPSYRGIHQRSNTTVSVNIAEANPAASTLPEFSLTHNQDLRSHYFGGVVGGTASFLASETVILTLGLEGGLYGMHASLSGQDSYSTCCGVDPFGVPSPSLTVQGDRVDLSNNGGVAFAGRASGAVTFALQDNLALTLGTKVDYLSRVARTEYNGGMASVTTDNQNASWSSGASNAPSITFGDMWNVTGTVSLTGQF